MKKIIGIVSVICVLLLICCAAGGMWYLENRQNFFYTKVDNSKVSELPPGEDMKYKYSLECYSEKGKKKSLTFKTSKILREDAYLMLEVRSFGVHKWEEIEYDKLPSIVQEKIK